MAKSNKITYLGTGRRKSSVARVRLVEGTGKITINGKIILDASEFEQIRVATGLDIEQWRSRFLQ